MALTGRLPFSQCCVYTGVALMPVPGVYAVTVLELELATNTENIRRLSMCLRPSSRSGFDASLNDALPTPPTIAPFCNPMCRLARLLRG